MKVIPKLLGGGFTSFFPQWTPVQIPKSSTRSTTSSKQEKLESEKDDSKGKITEKDLFLTISRIDMLPSDMQSIVNSLDKLFKIQLISGEDDLLNMSNSYLYNLYLIKIANFNKKEYDAAKTEVTKNGGLNECAITDSGDLVVKTSSDKIRIVSVKEFLNNRKEYTPLTNGEFLGIRATNPLYAYKNDVLHIVTNGIGMNEVDKMIREKISSLGTTESIRSGYSVKTGSLIIQGLQVLSELDSKAVAGLTGMTLDGMYKNEIITKDLKELAAAALNYIYNALPVNAKSLLSLKSGNASNPEAGAKKLILQLIMSKMDYSNSSKTDWEGTIDSVTKSGKSKDGSKDGSEESSVKSSSYYNMSRGIGGEPTKIRINKGSKAEMSVNGVLYSSITDMEDKPIGKTSLQQALESGLQGIATDPTAITFGNNIIKSHDFENVMIDGSAGGTLAILPAKISDNGTKVVDLEVLERFEEAMDSLRPKGIYSVQDAEHLKEIAEALHKNGLDNLIDVRTGGIDFSSMGQFLIMDGYFVDDSDKQRLKNSKYVTKVDDDSDEILMIERALSTNDDENNYKIDVDNWYDFNGHNEVYKGSIYLPVTNNLLKAVTASGMHIKEDPATEKEYEWQLHLKRMQVKVPRLGIL